MNVDQGAYRDDEGNPVVLQCVKEAEAKIAGSHFLWVSLLSEACSLWF